MLRSRIESLPDDHRSKPDSLFWLSRLFYSMGNYAEQKSLLLHGLALRLKEGNVYAVAQMLTELSGANRLLELFEEGIRQAKAALEIMERVGGTADRAQCLWTLAYLLHDNKQLDAAQDAISSAINLWEEGQELEICQSHQLLGDIHTSKGRRKEAIHHLEVALGIASRFEWHDLIFWIHDSMAWLFYNQGQLDDAQAHITQARLHAIGSKYYLGRAMMGQAIILDRQNRLEDAVSEALRAKEIYGKFGATTGIRHVKDFLQRIERAMETQGTSVQSDASGEPLEATRCPQTY